MSSTSRLDSSNNGTSPVTAEKIDPVHESRSPIAPEVAQSFRGWDEKQWLKMVKGWRQRKKPIAWSKLLDSKALLWGLGTEQMASIPLVSTLISESERGKKGNGELASLAHGWLDELPSRGVDTNLAFEALAWAQGLPGFAQTLEQSLWCRLCAAVVELAERASTATVNSESAELPCVLLASELCLTLAYCFPEIASISSLRHLGRQTFGEAMDYLLDGEGTPHANRIPDMQLLLASSVRSIVMDGEIKKGAISKDAKLQFDWLTRQTLRWSRPDGSPMLSPHDSPYFDDLLATAVKSTRDKADAVAYKVLRGKRKPTPASGAETPEWSEHSEWSEVAVMRTDWDPAQCQVAIAYANRRFRWEVGTHGRLLLSGISELHLEVDHQELHVASDWAEVCWDSNDDCDYMELEMEFNKGWKVQRQIVLAREDQFLYIADAVLGTTPSNELPHIHYRHHIPFVSQVHCEGADETTEIHARIGNTRIATVVPLALSEWKIDSRTGRFSSENGSLAMQRTGRALYAPLFIDLNPRRLKKPLTWRQLTVAENLQLLPPDIAAAFRMQVGKEQWIFYRSLAGPGNRTFLGVNTISEFLAASFDTDGQVESFIDISGDLEEE